MANIAQTINVLQAMALTDGGDMVLTPTYHVFDLFKAHQNAREIDCFVQSDMVGEDKWQVSQVSASASEKDGVITVTMANLSADKPVSIAIDGVDAKEVSARILKGAMGQYNDFGNSTLAVEDFNGCTVEDGKLTVHLPACCVAEITIQ